MKNRQLIFTLLVSLFIVASCSNSNSNSEKVETALSEDKVEEKIKTVESMEEGETNESLTLTDPLETVKALFQAALDHDIDTFFELGKGYLNKYPTPPPEMMASQAEIIQDHSGIENMTIEVIDEEKLTEQYAYFIEKIMVAMAMM